MKKTLFNEKHGDLTAVFRIIHPENLELIRTEDNSAEKSGIRPY
ncbi:hypothetical protein [Pseudalkalibacillus decolorationis]|nr:hypothetical protein [Pseudalkalibacillus decolorationis]